MKLIIPALLRPMKRFPAADKNKDGRITADAARVAGPDGWTHLELWLNSVGS